MNGHGLVFINIGESPLIFDRYNTIIGSIIIKTDQIIYFTVVHCDNFRQRLKLMHLYRLTRLTTIFFCYIGLIGHRTVRLLLMHDIRT